MEIGIKEAKNNLSKLVDAAVDGEEVFLTNRGARMIQLVPAPKAADPTRGPGRMEGQGCPLCRMGLAGRGSADSRPV